MSARRHHPHNPNDVRHGGADAVVEAERQHLLQWRGREPLFGLALSGGGYIGTSMSYLLSQTAPPAPDGSPATGLHFDVSREHFPDLSYPMVRVPPAAAMGPVRAKGRLLHRLRQNAKYLTAGNGITLLSVVGVLLRNLVVSALVHVAVLLLLALSAELHGYRRTHADFPNQPTGDQFFDERQFEAHRELGYMACWHLLQDLSAADAAVRGLTPQARPRAGWQRPAVGQSGAAPRRAPGRRRPRSPAGSRSSRAATGPRSPRARPGGNGPRAPGPARLPRSTG